MASNEGLEKVETYEQIYTFARPQQKMTREKAISFLTNLYNDPVATYSALGVECSSTEKPDQVLTSGSIKWEIPNLMKNGAMSLKMMTIDKLRFISEA